MISPGACRPFKDNLRGLYSAWNASRKVVEVVVVSDDPDKAAYTQTISGYPWLALPMDAPNKKVRV